jgi:hypothetical protein
MQTINKERIGYSFEGEMIGRTLAEAAEFLLWLGARPDEIVEVRSNERVFLRIRLKDLVGLAD